MSNFIGIYPNILSEEQCQTCIQYFENHPVKYEGAFSLDGKDVVDKKLKDSTDVSCNFLDYNDMTNIVLDGLEKSVGFYRGEYPDIDKVCQWQPCKNFNIQKYLPNQGYHDPHCEMDGLGENVARVMAWMVYLNTVTDGGQTRFPTWGIDVLPRAGTFVIWPAYFTHIHHGITSKTQTKYIATGWQEFV